MDLGKDHGFDYGLKLKIEEIVNASQQSKENHDGDINCWVNELKEYVSGLVGVDPTDSTDSEVSKSQVNAWTDCFDFIQKNLKNLSLDKQQFELVFEYSMPGTCAERPDVLLLTNEKVISLEFKKKNEPQLDDDRDDVGQALRYKNWLQNHHTVTRDRDMKVESYLVLTTENAKSIKPIGPEIEILTNENFCEKIKSMLSGETPCSFIDEWLGSLKSEMPDQIRSMEIMYGDGKIPYMEEVNKNCLKAVLNYINKAKSEKKKILILINGVPGSGKTAVGQSVVFEENNDRKAKAVYLSGNRPLVAVLQYVINDVAQDDHMAENAIQNMYQFKHEYFDNHYVKVKENPAAPEQSILVFDEAQRAWNKKKMAGNRRTSDYNRYEYSEPEGLFRVGERIFSRDQYAVIIGLYGNGQTIYEGEETDLSLWEDAIENHTDWDVIVSENLADQMQELKSRITIDNNVYLSASIRADFIDCSEWVEQAIDRDGATFQQAKDELEKIQEESMFIYLTRDFNKVRKRTKEIDKYHGDWTYGILISNFADENIINKVLPGWKIGYEQANVLYEKKDGPKQYGPWFTGGCKELQKAATVFDVQGLELDCPIIVFGGEYIRANGKWQPQGGKYRKDKDLKKYADPDTIVENNFRVLLTRARKGMILVIPEDPDLDETYQYFEKMGLMIL